MSSPRQLAVSSQKPVYQPVPHRGSGMLKEAFLRQSLEGERKTDTKETDTKDSANQIPP